MGCLDQRRDAHLAQMALLDVGEGDSAVPGEVEINLNDELVDDIVPRREEEEENLLQEKNDENSVRISVLNIYK